MTEGQNFKKRGKCKLGHCSSMSNSALGSNRTFLELCDMCPNSKSICQKQITLNPRQSEFESSGSTGKFKERFNRIE